MFDTSTLSTGAVMPTANNNINNNNSNSNNNNTGSSSIRRSSKQRKTNCLPPETVEYLKAWIMSPEHIAHPYPTEQEKVKIMADTGIEMKQLTNWFVNNRKRFWKPRVEARLQQQAHAAVAAAQAQAQVAAVAAAAAAVVSNHVNAMAQDASSFRPSLTLPSAGNGFVTFDLSPPPSMPVPSLQATSLSHFGMGSAQPQQHQPLAQPVPAPAPPSPSRPTQPLAQLINNSLQKPTLKTPTAEPSSPHATTTVSPLSILHQSLELQSIRNIVQSSLMLNAVPATVSEISSNSSLSGSETESESDDGCDQHDAAQSPRAAISDEATPAVVQDEAETKAEAKTTETVPVSKPQDETTKKDDDDDDDSAVDAKHTKTSPPTTTPQLSIVIPSHKRKSTQDVPSPRPKYRRISTELWRQSCCEASTPKCDSLPTLDEAAQLFGFQR